MEELEEGLKKTNNYRAAGEDKVKGEFLKQLPIKDEEKSVYGWGRFTLLLLLNAIFGLEECPTRWCRAIAWPVYKNGSKHKASNYRLITLLSVISKLLERILYKRINVLLQRSLEGKNALVARTQVGFQSTRSTLDAVYTLVEAIRMRRRAGLPTYVLYVDIKKAFPGVFKQGLFVKLHKAKLGGKCWRMMKKMYEKVQTRILSGYEHMFTKEQIEALHYDIETGLREGSILSPILYLIFINGLILEVEKAGLGINLKNKQTGESMWLGLLMYADDAACMMESPEEVQQLLDVIYAYASKWRFKIHEIKTQVMCFNEGENEKKQRLRDGFGEWRLGSRAIKSTPQYVYLGVLLTLDLLFHKHAKCVLGAAMNQTRESILLGVRRGDLLPQRARTIWKAYVESKFAYGAGMWLESGDTKTLQYINGIQARGAEQLMGISAMSEWELTHERAHVNVLTESGLMPAVGLQIQGVMRFYRIVKTRSRSSMLGMMWEIVEADRKMFKVEEGINNEVSKILEGHQQEEWPAYNNKLDWKAKINWLAAEAAEKWYVAECTEGKIGGNRDQYRRIREAEMDATNEEDEIERTEQELLGENRNRYSKTGRAEYLDLTPVLNATDTAEIAIMRTQYSASIRTHHKSRRTKMYGPSGWRYQCECKHHMDCTGEIDDTEHFLCRCKGAKGKIQRLRDRRDAVIKAALEQSESSMSYDAMTDYEKGLLLLGVPIHEDVMMHDEGGPKTNKLMYEILKASAAFIRGARELRSKEM